MTIYILDQDPKKCAQYLDDRSLDNMIGDIAQVLCNVHRILNSEECKKHNLPLNPDHRDFILKCQKWARECEANYLYFVEIGISLIFERNERQDWMGNSRDNFFYKNNKIIEWAGENIPDLPHSGFYRDEKGLHSVPDNISTHLHTPFPLVMPKKYHFYEFGNLKPVIIESYRNYYQAKLKQRMDKMFKDDLHKIKWTRREKPEWLDLK